MPPVSYAIPGLTLVGVVDENIRELVTQFSGHLLNFLSGDPDVAWSLEASHLISSEALLEKIPVNIFSGRGFEPWTGVRDYKDVMIAAMAVEAREWTDNFKYPMRAAMTGVYGGFPEMAAQVVANAAKMRPRIVANILMKGKAEAKTYQGIPLFVGVGAPVKHFYNPKDGTLGSFPNLYENRPFTSDNFAFAKAAHRKIKDTSGVEALMGLRLTHVLGGTDMEAPFLGLLKKSQVTGTPKVVEVSPGVFTAVASVESNIYENGAIPLIAPILDNDPYLVAHPEGQVWYSIAASTIARPVELLARNGGAPKVKVRGDGDPIADSLKSVLIEGDMEMNGAAGAPHTIIRWEYPGPS